MDIQIKLEEWMKMTPEEKKKIILSIPKLEL
jgi:predicted Fe-S protein YdhL (DUF1289 family)